MTKRLVWLFTGFGLGVAASSRARREIARLAPGGVAERMRLEVDAALAAGRQEMRRTEGTLRSVLSAPGRRDPGQ
jgi:hypothetical protein